jgi:hypothetical protein
LTGNGLTGHGRKLPSHARPIDHGDHPMKTATYGDHSVVSCLTLVCEGKARSGRGGRVTGRTRRLRGEHTNGHTREHHGSSRVEYHGVSGRSPHQGKVRGDQFWRSVQPQSRLPTTVCGHLEQPHLSAGRCVHPALFFPAVYHPPRHKPASVHGIHGVPELYPAWGWARYAYLTIVSRREHHPAASCGNLSSGRERRHRPSGASPRDGHIDILKYAWPVLDRLTGLVRLQGSTALRIKESYSGSMRVTRSDIQFWCGSRAITIRGELTYSSDESHFAFDRRSIGQWDDGTDVDPSEVESVISEAVAQGAKTGVKVDVEGPGGDRA